MSENRTFVFGEGANSSLNALLPFLQQKGIDPAYLYGLMGSNNGFFGNNGFESIIALIIVAAIFGNGNFGFGNNGNNSAEREMLLSAVQRNGVDLSQLAQSIGVSNDRVYDAVGNVSTQISTLAGQQGLSFQQVINAVQSGNAAIASQLASCCCDLKGAIKDVAIGQERGFSSLAYATQQQTYDLSKSIADSTQAILAGQAAIEKRELQREIANLQEEKQTYKLGNMIAAATNPIAAELESIKCRLPKTEVISAAPDYVPVNRSINIPYAPYCGYGAYNGWNGNSLWG